MKMHIKTLVGLGLGVALMTSLSTQAAPVDIASLNMSMTSLDLNLNNQVHSFSTTDNVSIVMGSYQNPIVTMTDVDGDTVTIYTAPPNPAPSGTVDAANATAPLDVDFTSMLADFVLVGSGGGARPSRGGGGGSAFTVSLWDDTTVINDNTFNSLDNSFKLGWTTDVVVNGVGGRLRLCAGGRMGRNGSVCDTTTVLEGTVSTVPAPAAVWLFGSGLLGLAGIGRKRNSHRV